MISKEQIELLEKVKQNEIPLSYDYYNSNKLLGNLRQQKLISIKFSYESGNRKISRYFLTASGQNELSIYNGQRITSLKDNLIFPIITGVTGSIIGAITGSLVTYFLMK